MFLQWIKGESITETCVLLSAILTFVFVVEVVMKIIAFTPRGYWQSRRNRYDLLVTVSGVVWIFLQTILRVSWQCSVAKHIQIISIFRMTYPTSLALWWSF